MPAPPPAESPIPLSCPSYPHLTASPACHSPGEKASRTQVQSRRHSGSRWVGKLVALGHSPFPAVGSHACLGHFCPIREQGATRHCGGPPEVTPSPPTLTGPGAPAWTMVYYQSPAPPPTHTTWRICLFLGNAQPGTWLESRWEGNRFFFFQEESSRTFLFSVPGWPNFFSRDTTPAAEIQ